MPLRSYPRLAALAVALALPLSVSAHDHPSHEAAAAILEAARQFRESLPKPLLEKATLPFTDAARSDWKFVPGDRLGLTLKEMDAKQSALALGLLSASLSIQGYGKATDIVSLEKVLFEIEGASHRDSGLYHVMIFGTPSEKEPWAWRFEGHHLSLSFTIADGSVVGVTPDFWGANPAEIRQGKRMGHRALPREEDLARALVKSLSAEQRATAVFHSSPLKEIVTRADARVSPLDAVGLAVSAMDDSQKAVLVSLLREYIGNMPAAVASERMGKLEAAGMGAIRFGWAGGLEKGDQHYYRLQGPTFLIEYTNFQGNGNHIHAVWRDFDGDFGRDFLKEHFEKHAH